MKEEIGFALLICVIVVLNAQSNEYYSPIYSSKNDSPYDYSDDGKDTFSYIHINVGLYLIDHYKKFI